MKIKSWLVLAMVLAGCPALELPNPDGGVDGEGSDDADCGSKDCQNSKIGSFPGAAGGGGSDDEGSSDGSSMVGFDAGAGDHEVEPSRPAGDAVAAFETALDEFYTALCSCVGGSLDECTHSTAEERACDSANLEAHADVAGPWIACVAEFLQKQAECVSRAACEPVALSECAIVAQADSGDPFLAACGEPPAALDEAASACDHTPMFPCFAGGEVPGDAVCNGVSDCSDGSDESVCGGGSEQFACGDGESIPAQWVCDGEADCSTATDEVDCGSFACGDGSSIPAHWVCDAEADCTNASDEQSCD
jgi:hypothetical protein